MYVFASYGTDFCLTLFLERIRIQLPRPGMPSLGIEVDVLIQLPRPGTPSLNSIAKAWNAKSWN